MYHRFNLIRGGCMLLAAVLFALAIHADAVAQRIVNINPGFGTLNTAITGDTLANGTRTDSNTVYRLQRGGLYILNGTLEHRYQVIIEAAPGAGAKPRIIQGVPSGGVAPAYAWNARGTLRMKNIFITALDELGGGHERCIRIGDNNVRLTIDSCVLNGATQAGIRFDGTGAKVYFYNSVISNIGSGASPNNGRGLDDRGNDIDTLWLENSTFYNLTSRVIRDAGGITNSCKVNHCTIYNTGQWGVSFGVCREAIFTNNLLINGGYYGANPRGIDLTGGEKQILVTLLPLASTLGTQTANIRNNSIYLDSLIIKAYPDTIKPEVWFDSTWTSYLTKLGTSGTIYSEKIVFTHAPDPPANIVADWYVDPAPPNPELDTVGVFDFKYPATQLAYTRGSDGKPLGALTWLSIPLTSVQDLGEPVPGAFRLYENYPNPFNPETNIRFDIQRSGDVVLEIFNSVGQKVATLVNQQMAAGSYNVRWNGSRNDGSRVSSGVYLYRLSTNGAVDVKKMAFVK
jgi:hypothetical protein